MSLATALERAAEALPSEADVIRPANGDPVRLLAGLSPESAVRVLVSLLRDDVDAAEELLGAWLEEPAGVAALLAVSEEGLPKPARKLVRRAQHFLKSQGLKVEGTSRDRGMVFQQYTSFEWLTVQDNVEYGLKLAGVPRKERHDRSRKVLAQVGLDKFANAYPKELSGGMKQRVAIARTLVNQPKLVLMDEPFGALDPQTRWGMQTTMLDVLKTEDNTVVFVTHDVAEAVYLADTIFVLSHRPARVLHRIDVPTFESRDVTLKQSAEFKRVENQVLELLHSSNVQGNIRVGL